LAGRPRDDLLVEGGPDLADRLVLLLAHPHPAVRERALAALAPFPPVRLPADPLAWRAWWAKGRDGLAAESRLATERRAAVEAAPRSAVPLAPGEADTTDERATERWRDLERIHREGLDIVVCLDETGSMASVIDAAKSGVVRMLRRMRALAPRFRVGLVTYNDEAFMRFGLTTEDASIETAFRRLEASGGGDEEEGVDRAIALALRQEKMGWGRKTLRVIVVVGDAPPHEEDVERLLAGIRRAREDVLYDVAVRVDTISTIETGHDDERVPHFRAIARAGGGTALRLEHASDLATALLTAPFGPAWREPLRELLADLDRIEAAGSAARGAR
ncbi:MAG TPA: vWA domain-containing protein, partial [Planctomycetota bacterium]|nr:vWA domain-containing protein [Planctomycetota bacterium]